MDGRTENFPILQDFVPYLAAAQKAAYKHIFNNKFSGIDTTDWGEFFGDLVGDVLDGLDPSSVSTTPSPSSSTGD